MNKTELAEAMREMLAQGISPEEIAEKIGAMAEKPSTTSSRPVVANRVEWIQSLTSISDLKKAIKIAFAKKSKSKDKPGEAKHQAEIDAGKAHLNELIADYNQSTDPIRRAIELDEEPGTIIQMLLKDWEKEAAVKIEAIKADQKWTNKDLKERLAASDKSIPTEIWIRLSGLGQAFLDTYSGRTDSNDARVQTLNRQYHLIQDDFIRGNKELLERLKAESETKEEGQISEETKEEPVPEETKEEEPAPEETKEEDTENETHEEHKSRKNRKNH